MIITQNPWREIMVLENIDSKWTKSKEEVNPLMMSANQARNLHLNKKIALHLRKKILLAYSQQNLQKMHIFKIIFKKWGNQLR